MTTDVADEDTPRPVGPVSELRIIEPRGADELFRWTMDDSAAIMQAHDVFTAHIAEHYIAWETPMPGYHVPMRTFRASARRITMAPSSYAAYLTHD